MAATLQYDRTIHHRRSIRLRGYDYSRVGAYFVTVCTQNQLCLFGEIVNGAMELNGAGRIVQYVWEEIPIHYQDIETEEFVVMPNHIHGIIVIAGPPHKQIKPVGAAPRVCPDGGRPQGVAPTADHLGPGLSLPEVVERFKTMTTKRYADGVRKSGWRAFSGKLWQRNYYDHIIRNEDDLHRIREYITNNPTRWPSDEHNPMNP